MHTLPPEDLVTFARCPQGESRFGGWRQALTARPACRGGGGPGCGEAGHSRLVLGRGGQGRAGLAASHPPPPRPVGVAPRGVRAGPTRELPASGPGLGPRADSHCPPAAHQRGGGPQGRPGVARRAQARPCAAEGALGTRSRASAPLPRAAVDAPPPGGIACSGFEDATKPNSSSTAEAQRGDAFTRSGPRAPPGASWTPATRRCPWLKTASPGGALLPAASATSAQKAAGALSGTHSSGNLWRGRRNNCRLFDLLFLPTGLCESTVIIEFFRGGPCAVHYSERFLTLVP